MASLKVSRGDGTYLAPSKLWVADASGTYQLVKDLAVADAGGTYRKGLVSSTPADPTLGLTLRAGVPSHQVLIASWPSLGPSGTLYQLFNGSVLIYNTSSLFERTITGLTPYTDYALRLVVTRPDGTTFTGTTVTRRTASLPAPANLRLLALTPEVATMSCDSVPGASRYAVYDYYSGYVGESTTTDFLVGGKPSGTSRSIYVKAQTAVTTSPASNRVDFTVPFPATTGPPAGEYRYGAVSASTWERSPGRWRPDSDGLYHGNGREYGSSRGNQSSWFFYGTDVLAGLRGGRVVRFQVYLNRTDDAGASVPQDYRWILHGHTGRPVQPFTESFPLQDTPGLARGGNSRIDLPVAWGQRLVDGSSQGIAMGDVDLRYARHNSLAADAFNGTLFVTIG